MHAKVNFSVLSHHMDLNAFQMFLKGIQKPSCSCSCCCRCYCRRCRGRGRCRGRCGCCCSMPLSKLSGELGLGQAEVQLCPHPRCGQAFWAQHLQARPGHHQRSIAAQKTGKKESDLSENNIELAASSDPKPFGKELYTNCMTTLHLVEWSHLGYQQHSFWSPRQPGRMLAFGDFKP